MGVDLPGTPVDPESTTTPLDMLWEMYSRLMYPKGDETDPAEMLFYAARESGKTLNISMMEILAMLHVKTDVVHLAAQLDQAQISQRYLKKFLTDSEDLRGIMVGDNVQETMIVYYVGPEGDILYSTEWKALNEGDKAKYRRYMQRTEITAATIRGTNSKHAGFLCVGGDVRISVQGDLISSPGRTRKHVTVRGLFRKMEGRAHGGRPSGETEVVLDLAGKGYEVWSMNMTTGALEKASVVQACRSWRAVVDLITSGSGRGGAQGSKIRLRGGRRHMVCGTAHAVLVPGRGFVQMSELRPGDRVVVWGKAWSNRQDTGGVIECVREQVEVENLSADERWDQVLLGSLLGDCGIYYKNNSNPWLNENHAQEQAEYLEWKRSVLSLKIRTISTNPTSGFTGKPLVGIYGAASPVLLPYKDFRKTFDGLERLGRLGLAVWYMDDGCAGNGFRISTEGWDEPTNQMLAEFLHRRFGLDVELMSYERDGKKYWCLVGGVGAKRRLSELCRQYIHSTMAYKFDLEQNQGQCKHCGRKFWYYERGGMAINCDDLVCRMITDGALRVETVEEVRPLGERWTYDFRLDRNFTYLSNGYVSHNCLDELDTVQDPRIIGEAKNIPSPIRRDDGSYADPLTVYTSTRKTAVGPVQKAIDNMATTGLVVKHFNVLEVTQRCPVERHRPDLPRLRVFRSDELQRTIDEATYEASDPKTRERFVPDEAYTGCIKNCTIFAACKGYLATKPELNNEFLKPLSYVVKKIQTQSLDYVRSQLLCQKPSSVGLIYGHLIGPQHVLSPAQAYERVFGRSAPAARMTKVELLKALGELDVKFYGGQDYGTTHAFAFPMGFKFGNSFFLMRCPAATDLDPAQKLAYAEPLRPYDPEAVWGDPEDPGMIQYMKKHGWRMREWSKAKGSVVTGIDIVKDKLMPMSGVPELFFVYEDDGDEEMGYALAKMREHSWKLDAAERPTNIPSDVDKDIPDAIRYLVMNLFPHRRQGLVRSDDVQPAPVVRIDPTPQQAATRPNPEMQKILGDLLGDSSVGLPPPPKGKGGIKFAG